MLLLIFKITVPIKAYFKSSKIDKLLIFLQFRSNLQQNACFFLFFLMAFSSNTLRYNLYKHFLSL